MPDEWVTVAEAVGILGVSERTVRRRIEKGELESKVEENTRLVRVDKASGATPVTDQAELVEQLRSENEYLRKKLDDHEQARERQDTIILQLTRQLEQSQRMLEYHQEPWYRRWFRKQRSGENDRT